MTIFWHKTGPLIYYSNGGLGIEDLNPEQKMRWRIGRLVLIRIALKCIIAACFA
jgi:hypothetical protein